MWVMLRSQIRNIVNIVIFIHDNNNYNHHDNGNQNHHNNDQVLEQLVHRASPLPRSSPRPIGQNPRAGQPPPNHLPHYQVLIKIMMMVIFMLVIMMQMVMQWQILISRPLVRSLVGSETSQTGGKVGEAVRGLLGRGNTTGEGEHDQNPWWWCR